jgi:hypothetical protein
LVRQSASHFTRENKKKIGDNSSLQKLSGSPKRFFLFHSKSKQISRLTNSVELSMFPIDGRDFSIDPPSGVGAALNLQNPRRRSRTAVIDAASGKTSTYVHRPIFRASFGKIEARKNVMVFNRKRNRLE